MEPVFETIPLASNQYDASIDEAIMNEITENSLKYKTFNKNEVRYLYNSLIDNCIYFLETTYESLYASKYDFNHQEFHLFAENIIRKARVTIPLLYSIMYYIKRFRSAVRKCPKAILTLQQGITINSPEDLKKIFVTAAVISLKFFNDRVILNYEWKKFIDISVEEINLCERQFFQLIEYNLNLNVDNYYIFINDYLNKFKTKSNNFPTESYPASNKPKTQSMVNENFTFSNDQPIITINREIPNGPSNGYAANNTQTISSNSNAFLTITPTPSESSPYNDTPNNVVSPEKPLTPNEVYYDNNVNTNYQNNGCYPSSQNTLYNDPMSADESSPQNQYNNNVYGNNFVQIPRNDTDSTIYNNSMDPNQNYTSTYYPTMNSPNSPTYYPNGCNGNDPCGNFRSNSEDTLKNNLGSTFNSPEYVDAMCNMTYSTNTVYHPSEDAVLREHLNNTNMPLNKLLYNLHHYHMKQHNTQPNYSSM